LLSIIIIVDLLISMLLFATFDKRKNKTRQYRHK